MKKTSGFMSRALALTATILLMVVGASAAATEQVIYNFPSTASGASVQLISQPLSGRLYGTAPYGGNTACQRGCGGVFELAPKAGGGSNYHTLYEFTGGADGAYPTGKMVIDASGNLYSAVICKRFVKFAPTTHIPRPKCSNLSH